MVVVETERLILRELEPGDLDFLAELLGDPQVMHFWPRPYSREEAAEWIERHRQRYVDHGHGYWLAIEKTTGQPIGQIGLLRSVVEGVEEENVGYILAREAWGKGFATEGAQGCLDYLQERFPNRDAAILIRPENLPSLRVAERLGFVVERETTYADLRHFVLRKPAK